MYLKEHIVRVENMKILQALDSANIDHKVIAMFMTCEGIPMQEQEVSVLLNQYEVLGQQKLPTQKVQMLMEAKYFAEEDDTLPCPPAY